MPSDNSPKAVIFDAYGTLFDVYSVAAAAEQLFPGQGAALAALWRTKQIEYTQLRTLSSPRGEHYRPFWDITADALRYAAASLRLTLSPVAEKRLMDEYTCLSAFPENLPVLRALRAAGLGLAVLSNGDPRMLDIGLKSAGMRDMFDHVLSVDVVRKYKTAPEAYQLGTKAFGLKAEEIVFVSSNGWDVAGAAWFGYVTFWVNRAGLPVEQLGVTPQGMGRDMRDLQRFVESQGTARA
ncbi:2-haloalkanoic acid dehalogenase [Pandoraea terrae]|uniref:(S)-2-haloacid dehalogenase n=1 Tax=Pandoraea terrae TaxID=1537710 RepID=A0A5E4WUD6_9BURK|nr:haloacid dehalogenase type II [Pandoraea terrae]VVE27214.1 2-haloalkanoic acid dehalogenase [Pandoraea terrae]